MPPYCAINNSLCNTSMSFQVRITIGEDYSVKTIAFEANLVHSPSPYRLPLPVIARAGIPNRIVCKDPRLDDRGEIG